MSIIFNSDIRINIDRINIFSISYLLKILKLLISLLYYNNRNIIIISLIIIIIEFFY